MQDEAEQLEQLEQLGADGRPVVEIMATQAVEIDGLVRLVGNDALIMVENNS